MKLQELYESGWITKFDKIAAQIAHMTIKQAFETLEKQMNIQIVVKYGGPRFNKGPMEVIQANVNKENLVTIWLTRNVKIKKHVPTDVPNLLSKLRHELSHVQQHNDPNSKLGDYSSPSSDMDDSEIKHHHNHMMYIIQPTERSAQATDAAEALHHAGITPEQMFAVIDQISAATEAFAKKVDFHHFIKADDIARLREPAKKFYQYDSLGYQIGNLGLGMGYNRVLGNDLAKKAKAQYKQYIRAVHSAYSHMAKQKGG